MITRRGALFLVFCWPLISCVSVQLPSSSGRKAERVEFQAPSSPFQAFKAEGADQAWVSERTGNTISYLSDCFSKIDPHIDQLLAESLNTLSKLKILEQSSPSYNGREARRATAEGELDGVPIRVRLLVLKKNDCNYTLSYTALPKNFEQEEKAFELFLERFKAP